MQNLILRRSRVVEGSTDPNGSGHDQDLEANAEPSRVEARARRRDRRRAWRWRVAVLVVVGLLAPVAVSYVRALRAEGTESAFIRTVEWVRHHGGNGVVNTTERWWYTTFAAPRVGGRPGRVKTHGTRPGVTTSLAPAPTTTLPPQAIRLEPPTRVVPTPAATPEPAEGAWSPAGRLVAGFPAIYTTFVRPDAVHTSYFTALMWIDTKLLKTVYVPGLQQPGGGPGPWEARIPENVRGGLVASFNSGFQMIHARGGAYVDGREPRPLRDGGASLVVRSDGSATVGAWGRDFQLGPDVVAVRQNLELIIDGGELNPAMRENDTSAFGATVGNNVYVWRSGIGVTPSGALIYAGGPAMSILSLAKTLKAAGAVRAMELDINSDWVSAYLYASPEGADPTAVRGEKLHQNMSRDGTRHLVPGSVDFFALFADPEYPPPPTTSTTTTVSVPARR